MAAATYADLAAAVAREVRGLRFGLGFGLGLGLGRSGEVRICLRLPVSPYISRQVRGLEGADPRPQLRYDPTEGKAHITSPVLTLTLTLVKTLTLTLTLTLAPTLTLTLTLTLRCTSSCPTARRRR